MDEESLYLDAHNYDYYRLAHKKLTNVLEWGIYLSIFGWDEVGADEKNPFTFFCTLVVSYQTFPLTRVTKL